MNVALIRTLFAEDELEHWFGTRDIRDDDGSGADGTVIDPSTAWEIYWRYRRSRGES